MTFTILTDSADNVIGIRANGTASAETSFVLATNSVLQVLAGLSLKLNGSAGGSSSTYGLRAVAWNGTNTSGAYDGDSVTFTPTSAFSYVEVRIFSGTSVSNKDFYPMLRLSTESDATFAPYSNICPITGWTGAKVTVSPTTDEADGTTYSITFPTEAGTVYGGSLDVTNGVLTVDRGERRIQNQDFRGPVALDDGSGKYVYQTGFFPKTQPNLLSNRYKQNVYTRWELLQFGEMQKNTSTLVITVPSNVTTIAEANEYFAQNETVVVYELATPITYQLTPQEITTLLGNNNVWADTGETTVTYKADIQKYIDKKLS